jgi:hypothetical protein
MSSISYFFDGKDCGGDPHSTKIAYKKEICTRFQKLPKQLSPKKIKNSAMILPNSHELDVALIPKFLNPKLMEGTPPSKIFKFLRF